MALSGASRRKQTPSSLGGLVSGPHRIAVKMMGNRFNTFGSLHSLTQDDYQGPWAWRTTGQHWSYEYHTRPIGLLSAPRILTAETDQL
jgi:hypothetical protein